MFFQHLLHHPRRLWVRKAIFQVHLWGGVLLTLYLVVIALSGSVLVFEDELTRMTLPPQTVRLHAGTVAVSLSQIAANAEREHPALLIDTITAPTSELPAYLLQARLPDGSEHRFIGNAVTGDVLPLRRTWVEWVHDLHIYLLLNKSYGMQVNAVGAAILMLLTLTGIMLWWAGLRTWSRGLRVNLRAGWRRINYDLHSAIGFWTLAIVFWWAFSGMYFGFYQQVDAAVNAVLPIRNMHAPQSPEPGTSTHRVSLAQVLDAAQRASPQGHLYSATNVSLREPVAEVLMDLGAPADFTHRDIVRVDTANGQVLSIWHYGEKHSAGDWVMWLIHPLHYGTLWGLAVKVVWCCLGALLAALAVTGLLMYWNRYARRLFQS